MADITTKGMSQSDLVTLLDRTMGTMWLPAGAFVQSTDTDVEVGSSIPSAKSFDTGADENACVNIYIKDDVDCTLPMSIYIYYSVVSASGTIMFDIDYLARKKDEDVGVTVSSIAGTAVETGSTADDLEITGAYTLPADACKNGDILFLNIRRDVTEDDASGDADMYGVRIEYTTRPKISS